jgi:hypothetical protein
MDNFRITSYATIGIAFIATYILRQSKKRLAKLPPGPPKLPILGNYFNMPAQMDTKTLTEIGKEIGT